MSADAFGRFLVEAVAHYAADNMACGRWSEATALQRSKDSFSSLLPQGLATPDNFVYEICAAPQGETVGWLWFAVVDRDGTPSAYVYNLAVDASHRRQGHASRAFRALESLVRGLGLPRIGLHVFAHNPGAQALYRSLGYAATGINMAKHLEGSTP